MNKVLVTGANGFIGGHLCAALQQQGIYVLAMLRSPSQGAWQSSVIVDLTMAMPSAADLHGVDTIFHLAGKAHAVAECEQDGAEYDRINSQATEGLLQVAAAAGVRRFVFFSSVKAITDQGSATPLDETSPCAPDSPYGLSKLKAEALVLQGGYVPEPVVLRPCMVYGESDKGNLPRMVRMVAKGLMPPLPDFGNQRAMVHVDDIVQAAILAAELPQAVNQIYIVSDGQHYSTRYIYEAICQALGRVPPRWHVPLWLLHIMARTGDLLSSALHRRMPFDSSALQRLSESACYSSTKIQQQLGFTPRRQLGEFLQQWLGKH
ncbi:MAG: NAD-dependent epimerase/dehydratase family protein [Mariprofundaceae bacterium]|nr:NAD-dependent epimerase/dehydratase family protein [Mariprofundaceae bacterium]